MFFAIAAQSGHLALVKSRVAAVIDEVRMGKIKESSGLQRFETLSAVQDQVLFSVSGSAVVSVTLIFVVNVVLSQQKVLDRIGFDQLQQPLPDFRVILCFQSQADLDIIPVFVPQAQDRIDVVLQLGGQHLVRPDISVGETVGRMIGKTQDPESGLYGVLDILLLHTIGVVASPGMGVVIGDHFRVFRTAGRVCAAPCLGFSAVGRVSIQHIFSVLIFSVLIIQISNYPNLFLSKFLLLQIFFSYITTGLKGILSWCFTTVLKGILFWYRASSGRR